MKTKFQIRIIKILNSSVRHIFDLVAKSGRKNEVKIYWKNFYKFGGFLSIF